MIGGQVNPATGQKEGGITVNPEVMERAALKGYATATDLADYLVKKGLPFRDAHETVAHAVKAATTHQVDLSELPLAVLQEFNPNIEKDVYECLSSARLAQCPQHAGRHRACPSEGANRTPPHTFGLKNRLRFAS